ncbi:hypothetical protein CTM45_03745 [Prevotella intermedia]|uniref:Uncharacterized protein n=1 Tax=Prevotella intermedia TaxID=28131 RepID=A0A2D3LKX5_PREIN|nr:hypothetical protein CTM46_07385 [Prevotella intermedia]PJI22478.1 hypothetical protein CTM45_03745 [Prevotella intermedia]
MNCYRIYSFFIHKLSNAAKVINKGHLRGFSLPNVHYARIIFTKLSKKSLIVSSKRLLKNACEIACLTCFLVPNQRIYIRCI